MKLFPRPASIARHRREGGVVSAPRRLPRLTREIFVVLAVKAAALFVIWWLWFSAPEAEHMKLPPQRMKQRLIEASAAVAPDPSRTSQSGTHSHASH